MAKIKFEDKITDLEKLINELESNETSLEDSIDKYTKAMKLIKECDKELSDYEEHISKIVNENGDMEDFEINE